LDLPRSREVCHRVLQLPKRLLPFAHREKGGYCVLRFPDSTESRWFDRLPTPGARIYSHHGHFFWGRVWVVDEVLQSGADTYTVFCVGREEYVENLRHGSGGTPDLAAQLLELTRHTSETVRERRRRWKNRNYQI
jgi:hypothetical protein